MQSTQLPNRKRFKTFQDWYNFLSKSSADENPDISLNKLRVACYEDIEKHRKRPLLVYATKFLEKTPLDAPNFIDLDDVNGFNDMITSVKDSLENNNNCNDDVDILLQSPGGRPDATERIVELLRSHFKKIDFLIPHSAYSAATMFALSGNNIILHPSAVLGPIDPQINGIPSKAIRDGFEKTKKKIIKEGPEALPAYIPLIEKYSLDLLELCEDSEKLSKKLVFDWLKEYMFKDEKNIDDEKIKQIVEYLSNYEEHLIHSRPLSIKKLSQFQLKIKLADKILQDLLWEAHILINGFFSITPVVKLYENTKKISWGKQSFPVLEKPRHKHEQQ